jgi:hypothetical protein
MDSEQRFDIAELVAKVEVADDPRDAYAKVQEQVKAYREAGWQVPDELQRYQRALMTELMAESQGR